jgi:hypothetical protein
MSDFIYNNAYRIFYTLAAFMGICIIAHLIGPASWRGGQPAWQPVPILGGFAAAALTLFAGEKIRRARAWEARRVAEWQARSN